MRKILPLTVVASGALALTACGSQTNTSATAPTTAAVPSVTASVSGGTGGAVAPTPSARTTSGGGGTVTADRLVGVDWSRFIERCPNAGQPNLVKGVTRGDVNGDGVPDTLVTTTCQASTSYWQSIVEVFDGNSAPGAPHRLAELLRDVPLDTPWVQRITIANKVVTITAAGTGERSAPACPTLVFTYRYQWTGTTLERVSRTSQRASDCQPIR